MLGVVVASSRVDDQTGYALTRNQVGDILRQATRPGAVTASCSDATEHVAGPRRRLHDLDAKRTQP